MSEPVARRVVVHGSVQGVFFRDTTRRRAESRRVAGWVRNNPDGTVEALFEGDPEAVDALVAFAAEGPRGAQVDRVDVEDAAPEGRGPLSRGQAASDRSAASTASVTRSSIGRFALARVSQARW